MSTFLRREFEVKDLTIGNIFYVLCLAESEASYGAIRRRKKLKPDVLRVIKRFYSAIIFQILKTLMKSCFRSWLAHFATSPFSRVLYTSKLITAWKKREIVFNNIENIFNWNFDGFLINLPLKACAAKNGKQLISRDQQKSFFRNPPFFGRIKNNGYVLRAWDIKHKSHLKT